ncbi:hypothetical protein A7J71_11190 [Achromobacter insolitus]|uniref:hypothetical protein n=1 Tax=Achromobacter insolitus TaxID=217204 RepID=UPI0007C727B5|nr:hypothetical protein [Achromobacter insolitus]OAE72576.1 hypothetical protein A7J71_11190 [Achromobacter insolitus]
MSDTKHGWVTPRADGARARCGGPGVCATCDTEAMHEAMLTGVFGPTAVPAAAPAAGDARDAERYRTWRDMMIASNYEFRQAVADALPKDVGDTRPPTAAEWDAAIDAAIAAQQGKGGEA